MEWFKVKFLAQTPGSIKKFLKINNLTYIPISNEEKNGIRSELVMSTVGEYNVLLELVLYHIYIIVMVVFHPFALFYSLYV